MKNTPNISIIQNDVQRALQEDLGAGDVTANLLPEDLSVAAKIISREPMLVCGQPWAEQSFLCLNPNMDIQWLVQEGSFLKEPSTLCTIQGQARNLLTAERTALNFLQTLSATATKTHAMAQLLNGTNTKLLDTRKTIPGLRHAQKYAVTCGGGHNHRMGLYDAFLIKENHILACGSIKAAIRAARASHPLLFIEIEVENLDELHQALKEEPHRILLDNFTLDDIQRAVTIAAKYNTDLEVSGGIDARNIKAMASTGVDYISVGALTKSIQAIDLSLQITRTL